MGLLNINNIIKNKINKLIHDYAPDLNQAGFDLLMKDFGVITQLRKHINDGDAFVLVFYDDKDQVSGRYAGKVWLQATPTGLKLKDAKLESLPVWDSISKPNIPKKGR